MTPRLMQAAALLVLTACGGSPSAGAQEERGSTDRPFRVTPVAQFDTPWAMTFLPGSGVRMTNAALITEKEGRLWLVNAATGEKQEVSGLPAVAFAGEAGLGDVVADPEFAGNRRIFLSYAEPGPNGTLGAAVAHARLALGRGPPRLEGLTVIWRQARKFTATTHANPRIAFARDGNLFVSSADRSQMDSAQDLSSDLGKVLRMTAEGRPIPTPQIDESRQPSARNPYIWSYGHRNNLGLAFALDGRLWALEMGPRGGDELNLIERGKNYGWPVVSYGSQYSGMPIPDDHRGRGFEEPKLWWNPSISPAGLIIYSGDLFPQWKGDALFGALSGQSFLRADLDGANARKADRWDMGARIREVEQGPRGEIYLLEDKGRLLRLEPVRR